MAGILTYNGAPSVADLLAKFDAWAKAWKYTYATLGFGAESETTTGVYYALTALNTSITNTVLKQRLLTTETNFSQYVNAVSLFGAGYGPALRDIDNLIFTSQPAGWTLAGTGRRYLDTYINRLNASDPNTPAAPTWTPTLTATTGGAIPPTTSGAEPRVKVTYVYISGSTTYDYIESQPSSASGQTPLTGKNNAYTLAGWSGNVPAGVGKLRIYRQFDNNAGTSDPYYWDQDVTVTAGVAWSSYTVTLKQPDNNLKQDYSPPVWNQLPLNPEFAAIYASTMATPQANTAVFQLPTFQQRSFASPMLVMLNPINAFLGIANQASHGEFGRWVSTVYTTGAPLLTGDYTQGLQGYAGATALRARVTATLNGTASISNVIITYLDATHPTSAAGTTIAGPFSLTATIGDTVAITGLPSGAIVRSITGITVGTATTGTLILEATPVRAI